MKKVLIIGPYLPGEKYGGPVKSLVNMVESLNESYEFHIITNDRDLNSDLPYSNVEIGKWNKVGKANVLYIPKGKDLKSIITTLKLNKYDYIYTSSFFAKKSIIIQFLKSIGFIKDTVIVAPRGEFSEGALSIKSFKKSVFLKLFKILKLENKVIFTCTSEQDEKDIRKVFGDNISIKIAGNIVINNVNSYKTRTKKKGTLNIVTISRISKIKNIDYSLSLLKEIDKSNLEFNEITFDIYGPMEDEEYWKYCLGILGKLGNNIHVKYKGMLKYDEVVSVLSKYDIFLFPSKGENFGHVIQEALLAGCPVIISDQTPWNKLEDKKIGYDLSLNEFNKFVQAILKYLFMDEVEYSEQSKNAYFYACKKIENQTSIQEHKELFSANNKTL